ncbi:ferredoxin [Dactylosporangium sp. NPDC005555]|uniref:ferredoxin n=1 Tax=Dactylosporangium sp. NPDC005555 TaxID=3154889 RepID=UPI0033B4C726
MWRITVDHTCIGSGSCAGIAPDRFELDDVQGRAHPVRQDVAPDDEAVLDAMASCPMEAISVVDLATGRSVEI